MEICFSNQMTWDGLLQGMVGIFAVLIAILGWWISFRTEKKILDSNLRIEVYKKILERKRIFIDANIALDVCLGSICFPKIKMGKSAEKTIEEQSACISKVWYEYTSELNEKITDFGRTSLVLGNDINDWGALVPKLKKSHKDLFYEKFPELEKELREYGSYLSNLSLQRDWDEWNWEEIEKRKKEIIEKFHKISGAYFDDFFTELHNSLIGNSLKYTKEFREDFQSVSESDAIFTKEGIIPAKKILRKSRFLKNKKN